MGLFKSKEEKAIRKEEKALKAESKAVFNGLSLQPIGKIQQDWLVELSLDPYERKLHIANKKSAVDITIPYERLRGFRLEDETTIAKSGSTVGRALIGGALFGATGAIVGGMSAKGKTKTKWYGTLTYEDKNGETQELAFEEFSFGSNTLGMDFRNHVNKIAQGNAEEVTEL
jgi:hypothetical protein